MKFYTKCNIDLKKKNKAIKSLKWEMNNPASAICSLVLLLMRQS
jgi:hypothetical protein